MDKLISRSRERLTKRQILSHRETLDPFFEDEDAVRETSRNINDYATTHQSNANLIGLNSDNLHASMESLPQNQAEGQVVKPSPNRELPSVLLPPNDRFATENSPASQYFDNQTPKLPENSSTNEHIFHDNIMSLGSSCLLLIVMALVASYIFFCRKRRTKARGQSHSRVHYWYPVGPFSSFVNCGQTGDHNVELAAGQDELNQRQESSINYYESDTRKSSKVEVIRERFAKKSLAMGIRSTRPKVQIISNRLRKFIDDEAREIRANKTEGSWWQKKFKTFRNGKGNPMGETAVIEVESNRMSQTREKTENIIVQEVGHQDTNTNKHQMNETDNIERESITRLDGSKVATDNLNQITTNNTLAAPSPVINDPCSSISNCSIFTANSELNNEDLPSCTCQIGNSNRLAAECLFDMCTVRSRSQGHSPNQQCSNQGSYRPCCSSASPVGRHFNPNSDGPIASCYQQQHSSSCGNQRLAKIAFQETQCSQHTHLKGRCTPIEFCRNQRCIEPRFGCHENKCSFSMSSTADYSAKMTGRIKMHYENYYDEEQSDVYGHLNASLGMEFGLGIHSGHSLSNRSPVDSMTEYLSYHSNCVHRSSTIIGSHEQNTIPMEMFRPEVSYGSCTQKTPSRLMCQCSDQLQCVCQKIDSFQPAAPLSILIQQPSQSSPTPTMLDSHSMQPTPKQGLQGVELRRVSPLIDDDSRAPVDGLQEVHKQQANILSKPTTNWPRHLSQQRRRLSQICQLDSSGSVIDPNAQTSRRMSISGDQFPIALAPTCCRADQPNGGCPLNHRASIAVDGRWNQMTQQTNINSMSQRHHQSAYNRSHQESNRFDYGSCHGKPSSYGSSAGSSSGIGFSGSACTNTPTGAYPFASFTTNSELMHLQSEHSPMNRHALNPPSGHCLGGDFSCSLGACNSQSRKYSLPVQLESQTAERLEPNRSKLLFESNMQSRADNSSQMMQGKFGTHNDMSSPRQSQMNAQQIESNRRSSQTITRQSSFWLEDTTADSVISLTQQSCDESQLDLAFDDLNITTTVATSRNATNSQRPSISSQVLSADSIDSVKLRPTIEPTGQIQGDSENLKTLSKPEPRISRSSSRSSSSLDRPSSNWKLHARRKGRLSSSSTSSAASSPSPDLSRPSERLSALAPKSASINKRHLFSKLCKRRHARLINMSEPEASCSSTRSHKSIVPFKSASTETGTRIFDSPSRDESSTSPTAKGVTPEISCASMERQCRELWQLRATLHDGSCAGDDWSSYHQRLNRRYDSGYKSIENQLSSSIEGNTPLLASGQARSASLTSQPQEPSSKPNTPTTGSRSQSRNSTEPTNCTTTSNREPDNDKDV